MLPNTKKDRCSTPFPFWGWHPSVCFPIGVTLSDSESDYPSHIQQWAGECFPALWDPEEEPSGERKWMHEWGYMRLCSLQYLLNCCAHKGFHRVKDGNFLRSKHMAYGPKNHTHTHAQSHVIMQMRSLCSECTLHSKFSLFVSFTFSPPSPPTLCLPLCLSLSLNWLAVWEHTLNVGESARVEYMTVNTRCRVCVCAPVCVVL